MKQAVKQAVKKPPKKDHPFWGLRAKLMLFMCLFSAFVLGLVWFFSTQLLQPLYNRYIYTHLSAQVNTLAALIEASEDPISRRPLQLSGSRVQLNWDFWNQVNALAAEGKLDFHNSCVDIADSTLQYVIGFEGLYPCLLHETSGSLRNWVVGENEFDTSNMIAIRRIVAEQGSCNVTVNGAGDTQQLVVGKRASNGENGNYTVILSASLARVGEAAVVMGKLMPVLLAVLLAFSVGGAWWFSRWFTRPLTKLSHAARQMADGNYKVRVDVPTTDEIGLLAQDFNHMAGQVNRAAQLQRDLLANVSHDLRTPLTLIKGYAETVRDLTGSEPEKRTEQLNVIVDETDRLSGLVNSVMELSKVSSGTDQPQRVTFDIAQLCEEVAQRYDALCAQNGCRLQLQAAAPCDVLADPAMMERVLHNLLGNALHHIGEDGIFLLRVLPLAGGGARVEVEDHGAGIAVEDLPYIFDRYYRSRSDAGKVGTGLGLSITKAILQSHGFRFGVDSTLGQGSVFWFEAKNS